MRLVVAIAAVIAGISWYGVHLSTPGAADAEAFVVARGESVETITENLKAAGIVRSGMLFKYALRRSGLATRLQPGTYDLRGAETYDDIVRMIAEGSVAAEEFTLLVKEGWTLRDIKAELERQGYARADEIYHVTGIPATDHRTLSAAGAPKPDDLSAEFSFLEGKPSYVSLEGYLFPDTYRLYREASPEDIVRTMLRNFDRKVDEELRGRIRASGRSLHDVITMASIVEREVRTDESRRRVADIFWRRHGIGMALQADSTVNYVTGKSLAAVTFEDTKVDSEYNTYKYPGLPLGPIGNPGLAAIRATVDPLPNDAWYFLTDAEGNVHYGRTLDEHNRNKARYLR